MLQTVSFAMVAYNNHRDVCQDFPVRVEEKGTDTVVAGKFSVRSQTDRQHVLLELMSALRSYGNLCRCGSIKR